MVHQYKLNGYNIILDTCSGSVHTVDEVAYDIISLYKQKSTDEIVDYILDKYSHLPDVDRCEVLECIEDIKSLEKDGKLFTKDEFENLAIDYKNNSKVIKALCLHVAHTCNLNCSYCFASQGKYQGERALMSFETKFCIEKTIPSVRLPVFNSVSSIEFDRSARCAISFIFVKI